jgi:Ser/Thr protein kinase RdoA (MazF antagonist)
VIHGDLHLKNIFVTDSKVALIDLDGLQNGDPLQDLGSFLASIYCRALIHNEVSSAPAITAAILRGYADCVPWAVDPATLAWHTAAALIYEQALRCVTRLKARRQAVLSDIIELAASFGPERIR